MISSEPDLRFPCRRSYDRDGNKITQTRGEFGYPYHPFIAYFTSYSGDRLLFFLELNSSTAAKTLVFGQKGGRTAEDVWVGAFGLISFTLASIFE